MVRYQSEAWLLPETTVVGDTSWETGLCHFRERDGIYVGEIHRRLQEAAKWMYLAKGRNLSLPRL